MLRELKRQNTDEMRKEAKRYAEQRVPMLRAAHIPTSKKTAEDLVWDAISATFLGEGDLWDPAACDLLTHLRGLIKNRTWKEIRHRMLVRQVTIDSSVDDEVEDSLARSYASVGDVSPILVCAFIATVCLELRKIAPEDEDADRILECWENGFAERREVILLTGFDDRRFTRARDRILSRKRYLPPRLIATVEDILDRSA